MKKRIILFILCLCLILPLGGCSGAFDALNFNRKPLPNPSSPVDPSLEPAGQRVENIMTKIEFADLVERTFKDRDSFSETLTVSFAQSYNVQRLTTSVVVLDKTVVSEDKPYASYSIAHSRDYWREENEIFFFNDYFVDTRYQSTAYEIDSYLDDLNLKSYEAVKNGVLPMFFQLFVDNASNIYSDYHNGSQRTYVSLDDNLIDFLDSYAEDTLSAIIAELGEVIDISSLEIGIDNNTISFARLDLSYKYQKISFDFKLEQVEEEIDHSLWGHSSLAPSYTYTLKNTAEKYTKEDDSFYKSMPYQATISYTTNDLYKDLGLANEFSYYRTTFKVNDGTCYLKAVSSLDKTIFSPTYYPESYIYYGYLKQGEDISYLNSYRDDTSEYIQWINNTAWWGIEDLLYFNSSNTYSITENENSYTIVSDYTIEYDYYSFNRNTTFEVSKDFSKIYSVEYSVVEDGQLMEDRTIVFSYDFTLELPTEVLEFYQQAH